MLDFIIVEDANLNEKSDFANLQVVAEKGLQVFTFKQLHSATGGFSKSNVIGHGGFGLVYRGVLNDGRKVAIKFMDQAGKQGEEEFKVEVCCLLEHFGQPCFFSRCYGKHNALFFFMLMHLISLVIKTVKFVD